MIIICIIFFNCIPIPFRLKGKLIPFLHLWKILLLLILFRTDSLSVLVLTLLQFGLVNNDLLMFIFRVSGNIFKLRIPKDLGCAQKFLYEKYFELNNGGTQPSSTVDDHNLFFSSSCRLGAFAKYRPTFVTYNAGCGQGTVRCVSRWLAGGWAGHKQHLGVFKNKYPFTSASLNDAEMFCQTKIVLFEAYWQILWLVEHHAPLKMYEASQSNTSCYQLKLWFIVKLFLLTIYQWVLEL